MKKRRTGWQNFKKEHQKSASIALEDFSEFNIREKTAKRSDFAIFKERKAAPAKVEAAFLTGFTVQSERKANAGNPNENR